MTDLNNDQWLTIKHPLFHIHTPCTRLYKLELYTDESFWPVQFLENQRVFKDPEGDVYLIAIHHLIDEGSPALRSTHPLHAHPLHQHYRSLAPISIQLGPSSQQYSHHLLAPGIYHWHIPGTGGLTSWGFDANRVITQPRLKIQWMCFHLFGIQWSSALDYKLYLLLDTHGGVIMEKWLVVNCRDMCIIP